jgi:hypothetical protein
MPIEVIQVKIQMGRREAAPILQYFLTRHKNANHRHGKSRGLDGTHIAGKYPIADLQVQFQVISFP